MKEKKERNKFDNFPSAFSIMFIRSDGSVDELKQINFA